MQKNASTVFKLIILAAIATGIFFIQPYVLEITEAQKENTPIQKDTEKEEIQIKGNHIIANLDTNTLFVKNGNRIIKTITIVTQGKPGSYYETIGGKFTSDFKVPLHFSSLGHVYMPYSIHIFGNYFIHGIPYYPDGTKVSNTYSGGCVRLHDDDAKFVYDFITTETPIIITRNNNLLFENTRKDTKIIQSMEITRLMNASISLEFLSQEDEPIQIDNNIISTRKALLLRILDGTISMSVIYNNKMSEEAFLYAMNKKAETLGLSNTFFTGTDKPAITTKEDYAHFMEYIRIYKSYLLQVK